MPVFRFFIGILSPSHTSSHDKKIDSQSPAPFLNFALSMKEYAEKFYKSRAWEQCRSAYAKSKGGLCEVCLAKGLIVPGEIVHHKVHITPENINDLHVILDWNNLQLVCRECHAEAHHAARFGAARRYDVDQLGRVTVRPDIPPGQS